MSAGGLPLLRSLPVCGLPLLLAACAPMSHSIVFADKAITTGGYDAELTAVASPPGTNCPDGRLTIASLDYLWNGPLDGSSTFTNLTTGLQAQFPDQPDEPNTWGSDDLLARLPDGDLLYTRQGFVGLEPASGVDAQHVKRGVNWFWISEDCGQSWKAHSRLDSRDVLDGICAEPRKNPDGSFLASGWDRGELAVDPWKGTVYFLTSCGSDHPQAGNRRLFVLEDGTTTWKPSPFAFPWAPPAVMTVTASGALWVFECEGDKPMLYRSGDGGQTFPVKVEVIGNATMPPNGQQCQSVVNADAAKEPLVGHGSEELAGHQEVLSWDYSLSRYGGDAVRVAYPSLDAQGRARLRGMAVFFHQGDEEPTVLDFVKSFDTVVADASQIHPSFIERDDLGDEKNPNHSAVLYWLESSPGDNAIRVRFSVVRAGVKYTAPETLSGPWTPNFEPDSWITNWAGDYQNGAYYCGKDERMHFLLVWPQSDPDLSQPPNLGIHLGEVVVDEPCTP